MAQGTSLAMSTGFLEAFARLPGQQQRGVTAMMSKFRADSRATGLNLEVVRASSDPKIRSLRVDRDYRAIVRAPDEGSTHLLLWVDKHDDAYKWAERHECKINPETGALQIYDCMEIGQATSTLQGTHTAERPARPFAAYQARKLVRIGVPEAMVPMVKAIRDEDDLEEKKARLPVEAYQSLFYLLAGDSYEKVVGDLELPDEPVDTGDLTKALVRDESRSRFVLVHDEMELEAVLNAPLAKWRVFLHPTQRRLVERDWNGPVRLLGAAGTGKTVVAMHRARWLAGREGSTKILFVTFTKNLATDIRNNLSTICTTRELDRIEVTNLDAWVVQFLKSSGYDHTICYGRDVNGWQHALEFRPDDLNLPTTFYEAEWEQVVQANGVSTVDEYKRVSRLGRGTRLSRADRVKAWKVFEEYKLYLASRGIKEPEDAYRDAISLIHKDKTKLPYSSVIVDEAQDLGTASFKLIRSIVQAGKNDIFVTGDSHQRIYGRKAVLGRCGIDIRGRARKLYLNYRTTEQTRAWSARLLEGRKIDDLDGGRDDNSRIRSLTKGPEPSVRCFASAEEQAAFLAEDLKRLQAGGEKLADICIVARSKVERDAVGAAIKQFGVDTDLIDRLSDDRTRSGVRLATMHRVKGLEFERIVVASVNAGLIPPKSLWATASTESEREELETRERALLYVAASRAKKAVQVLSYGKQSRLLVG